MDNDTIPSRLIEQRTEAVALFVRKVLLPKQGITESQTGGNAVFLHQRQHFLWVIVSKTHTPSAPDAVRRCAVDGADVAPVVEIFPVLPEKRQKDAVELIKLEQAGKMVMRYNFLYVAHVFPASFFL